MNWVKASLCSSIWSFLIDDLVKSLSRCVRRWKQTCKVPIYSRQDVSFGPCEMETCTRHIKDIVPHPMRERGYVYSKLSM
jgi:hypothetical protein